MLLTMQECFSAKIDKEMGLRCVLNIMAKCYKVRCFFFFFFPFFFLSFFSPAVDISDVQNKRKTHDNHRVYAKVGGLQS